MTITKALRKLYKVIVGEEAPANANTITKVLLALAEAWTGSGGGSGGSGGSGGGGTEPLIIHVTEEGVKDPQTQELVGYKTDVLASDAYEAWQNGRPIYLAVSEDAEWLILSVIEHYAHAIITDSNNSLKMSTLFEFIDGYLIITKDSLSTPK